MEDTLFEDSFVRLWREPAVDARIAILSFKTKMHTVGCEVLGEAPQLLARADDEFDGLVLWSGRPFCAGADLRQFLMGIVAADWDGIEAMIASFQEFSLALRHCPVPVVAAVEGLALGGGCELAMHCARRVLAPDASLGLVEPLVGLIPGGAGCVELARRAAEAAGPGGDPLPALRRAFLILLAGTRSRDARHARELDYAAATDAITTAPVLPLAIQQARALADAGYRPPLLQPLRVAGEAGRAALEADVEARTDHDRHVGQALARVLCGAGIAAEPAVVSPGELCALERREFMALVKTPETRARIAHVLETGKPLRN